MVGGTSSGALVQVSSGSVPISHPASIPSTIRVRTSDEGGSFPEQCKANYEYDDNTVHVLLRCMSAVGYGDASKKAK